MFDFGHRCSIKFHYIVKQAGTGPSRRHIQGSKIAKVLQSVKVFYSTVPEKKLKKILTMPKKLEGRPFGIFQHFSQNSKKIERDPLKEKNSKKCCTMPKKN